MAGQTEGVKTGRTTAIGASREDGRSVKETVSEGTAVSVEVITVAEGGTSSGRSSTPVVGGSAICLVAVSGSSGLAGAVGHGSVAITGIGVADGDAVRAAKGSRSPSKASNLACSTSGCIIKPGGIGSTFGSNRPGRTATSTGYGAGSSPVSGTAVTPRPMRRSTIAGQTATWAFRGVNGMGRNRGRRFSRGRDGPSLAISGAAEAPAAPTAPASKAVAIRAGVFGVITAVSTPSVAFSTPGSRFLASG